jgi:transcriptional regulator with XRE-family HTH domain
MTFADRLRQLRTARGVTQAGLAAASGVSLGAVRDYEQGKKEPSAGNLVRLAQALGVTLDELAQGVEWAERGA